MTITTVDNRDQVLADGSRTLFPFSFRVDTTADFQVWFDDDEQVYGSGYQIEDELQLGNKNGGNIEVNSVLADGVVVTIIREVVLDQQVDYKAYDAFPSETHERALDKGIMIDQQHAEILGRAMQTSPYLVSPPSNIMPTYEPGKYLGWDVVEKALVNYAAMTGAVAAGTLPMVATSSYSTLEEAHADIGGNYVTLMFDSLCPAGEDVVFGQNVFFYFPSPLYMFTQTGNYSITVYSPSNISAPLGQKIIDMTFNNTDPLKFTYGGSDASPVSVCWFGPTGVGDNIAFSAADIAKVHDSVVIYPPGDYSVNAAFNLSGDNKKLLGHGANITLADESNSYMINLIQPHRDQTIEGFSLDGNRYNQSVQQSMIQTVGIAETLRLTVQKNRFLNASYAAMNIESAAESLVDNNYFDNSRYGHIRWHASDNSTISNNHFDAKVGDYSYMALALDGRGNKIKGNTFDNIPALIPALRLTSDGGYPARSNLITNNRFIGGALSTGWGINFDVNNVRANIISGNSFDFVNGINGVGEGNSVVGNTFEGCPLAFYPSGLYKTFTFTGNTLIGCAAGIRAKYCGGVISDNIFQNMLSWALFLEGNEGLIVNSNVFKDCGSGTEGTYSVIHVDAEVSDEFRNSIIKQNIYNTGVPIVITGVTLSTVEDPETVVIADNVLSAGQLIYIIGVVGTVELNGNWYTVANPTSDAFELSGIDSTAYTPYVSDGTATLSKPVEFINGLGTPVGNQITDNIINDDLNVVSGLNGYTNTIRDNPRYQTNNDIRTAVAVLTDADILLLAGASGYDIVPAPGADKFVEFVSAVVVYKWGGAGTYIRGTPPMDLVFQYEASDIEVSEVMLSAGLIDQANDEIRWVKPVNIKDIDLISSMQNGIHFMNDGVVQYTSSGDTTANTMEVTVNYRVHDIVL